MNIIYSACWADPWVQVAQKLQKDFDIRPVYWVGYEADKSEDIIANTFPGIYYHRYYDAWKGVFPTSLQKHLNKNALDIDFLSTHATYELQALNMMDRMDPDRHSFSFAERQRHYRKMLINWSSILDYLNPDAIISATVPHRVYDYVLYLLCKEKNIPFVSLRETAFMGRIIPIRDIKKVKNDIVLDYQKLLEGNNISKEVLLKSLPKDILDRYYKVNQDYKTAEPIYMKKHVNTNKKESTFIGNMKKLMSKIESNRERLFGKNGYLRSGFPTYHKKRNKPLEKSNFNFIEHTKRKLAANKYKNKLKSFYDSLVIEPDYNKPYVFFALHYQPEMTSNPAGDIFADQKLCIDVLVHNLPPGYYIYVKEHRSQFYAHTEGHTARIKEFYTDLLEYPNVKLVSSEANTFDLISNATAVSTVTGTIGWEAIARKKPSIIFGLAWYEVYDGVLKITNKESAKKIPTFIQEYQFNEKKLLKYLLAFSKNSFKAYYFRGLKDKMNMNEDDCINNLVNHVVNELKPSINKNGGVYS